VTPKRRRYTRDEAEFDRAIAFLDASFAVPLTLLITTLDVRDKPSSFTSVTALGDAIGPQFIAFLVAFAVIAGYWLRHHRMVASWGAIDTPTIAVNLCLVAAVVVLPFSTASVGDPAAPHRADGRQHRARLGAVHGGLDRRRPQGPARPHADLGGVAGERD